jgi:hypothetical protein
MLRPVGFDDQLSANAKKVDNVKADRNLPAKLESAEATIAKKAPRREARSVGARAHRSNARALVRRDACVGLHRSSIGGAAPRPSRLLGAPPSSEGRGQRRSLAHLFAAKKGAVHPLLPGEKVAG